MKRSVVLVLGVCAVVAASAGEARAQMTMGTFKGYLTGHVGAVTGGDVTSERMAAGASVGVHETTAGAPRSISAARPMSRPTRSLLDLTSYIVNAGWVKPNRLVRPFAGVGAGILQVDGCGSPCGVEPAHLRFGHERRRRRVRRGDRLRRRSAPTRAIFFSSADHPELASSRQHQLLAPVGRRDVHVGHRAVETRVLERAARCPGRLVRDLRLRSRPLLMPPLVTQSTVDCKGRPSTSTNQSDSRPEIDWHRP